MTAPFAFRFRFSIITLFIALIFASCSQKEKTEEKKHVFSRAEIEKENKNIMAFFEECYQQSVERNPELATRLGLNKHKDRWTDNSEAGLLNEKNIAQAQRDTMQSRFDFEKLTLQNQLSYRLFEIEMQKVIDGYKWRYHNYPVNQMSGFQTEIPAFLINMHSIDSVSDAWAYIERLKSIKPLFDIEMEGLVKRDSMKIVPPRFVFPLVIQDCYNIITGTPFDRSSKKSSLLQDFTDKINALKSVSANDKTKLLSACNDALINSVQPAYRNLIDFLREQERHAGLQDGCWKWPDGNKYYLYALKENTTTNIKPEEIFKTGEKEVKRIHEEMKKIMKEVGWKNDNLKEFFTFMRTDSQFFYANTPVGKKAYMDRVTAVLDTMNIELDKLFNIKPRARLAIKEVEPFRQQSVGTAFYEDPSPDGKRPGTYYINTYEMLDQPIYQLEALAYHEAIPGHHMQVAIAQELTNIPEFRKYIGNTAYVEGWALYSELVPKEIGLYKDPYSDFGRLSNEVFRAARLVVDVGIHYKKWGREQALAYFLNNTANAAGDSKKEIERYIVWPGQATGYKIGMMKIFELRENAKLQLQEKFNIKEFHDLVLSNGALPLNLLDEQVQLWIEKKLSGKK